VIGGRPHRTALHNQWLGPRWPPRSHTRKDGEQGEGRQERAARQAA
jgi:hypothetical protein